MSARELSARQAGLVRELRNVLPLLEAGDTKAWTRRVVRRGGTTALEVGLVALFDPEADADEVGAELTGWDMDMLAMIAAKLGTDEAGAYTAVAAVIPECFKASPDVLAAGLKALPPVDDSDAYELIKADDGDIWDTVCVPLHAQHPEIEGDILPEELVRVVLRDEAVIALVLTRAGVEVPGKGYRPRRERVLDALATLKGRLESGDEGAWASILADVEDIPAQLRDVESLLAWILLGERHHKMHEYVGLSEQGFRNVEKTATGHSITTAHVLTILAGRFAHWVRRDPDGLLRWVLDKKASGVPGAWVDEQYRVHLAGPALDRLWEVWNALHAIRSLEHGGENIEVWDLITWAANDPAFLDYTGKVGA